MREQSRYIVHVDMDAFFAAIEQRDNPSLRGRPVIVGANPEGGKGRGVVSTCSYEARKFGIRSAMPISLAYRRCPHAVFLPVDIDKYRKVSRRIYEIFYEFTPRVEAVSIDEAFLDITESFHRFGSPLNLCREIKSRIKEEVGLIASVGLAPTKMVAKIASGVGKPDGLVEVDASHLEDFLFPLPVEKLWGVGERVSFVLHRLGMYTIGDIACADVDVLTRHLGKGGYSLWLLARGKDNQDVYWEERIKSMSQEVTFQRDTSEYEVVTKKLMELCERLSLRLRASNLKGRTVTLKVRLSGFRTYTRSITCTPATNFADEIYQRAQALLRRLEIKKEKIRLVGVRVSSLVDAGDDEFIFRDYRRERKERLYSTIDRIKNKFGEEAICYARRK